MEGSKGHTRSQNSMVTVGVCSGNTKVEGPRRSDGWEGGPRVSWLLDSMSKQMPVTCDAQVVYALFAISQARTRRVQVGTSLASLSSYISLKSSNSIKPGSTMAIVDISMDLSKAEDSCSEGTPQVRRWTVHSMPGSTMRRLDHIPKLSPLS